MRLIWTRSQTQGSSLWRQGASLPLIPCLHDCMAHESLLTSRSIYLFIYFLLLLVQTVLCHSVGCSVCSASHISQQQKRALPSSLLYSGRNMKESEFKFCFVFFSLMGRNWFFYYMHKRLENNSKTSGRSKPTWRPIKRGDRQESPCSRAVKPQHASTTQSENAVRDE